MFERRLKIFLLLLLLGTMVLMGRALHVQVIQHAYWTGRASGLLQTSQATETTRGRILDFKGKELAIDVASTDVCVDYRAITDPPNEQWVSEVATARLRGRLGAEYRKAPLAQRKAMKELEIRQVGADVESMWATLAELYQPTEADAEGGVVVDHRAAIGEIRRGIEQRVLMRKRWVWYRTYQLNRTRAGDVPRWQKWLAGTSTDGPDIDQFAVTVGDEKQAHVVLRGVDLEAQNQLGKKLESFPGLVLRPSTHRAYPMDNVACHILGRLSRVSAQDVQQAKDESWDERRAYLPNDQIGREGIESLCEPLLRGSRGRVEKRVGDGRIVDQQPFEPGKDVRLTIDAELQRQVQDMLKHVHIKSLKNGEYIDTGPPQGLDMHAAAVVIDVKSGEVRALASNPDFNVNDLDERYTALVTDRLNNSLVNRATCDEFEPGSTVKPMIGLGAITQGLLHPTEGIECTGYLVLDVNGRKVRQTTGRCWVASEFAEQLQAVGMSVAHHPIPYPHRGHDGNPDGFLSYADALQRSCNVFFETVADRLGPAGIDQWYKQFGFGELTGIGIRERRGLRPAKSRQVAMMNRMTNCFAGIGQGFVWATPLQIANEAATVAREGVWMRPRLLTSDTQAQLDAVRKRPADMPPDRIDLHLDPEGLRQAKLGLVKVVNDEAGTGGTVRRADMQVAGKTGSAEGARIFQKLIDSDGREIREPLIPVNEKTPMTETPWYRSSDSEGKHVVHAWFMGFAPAEEPEVAFCVFIEYAGAGGGPAAGPVVAEILEACVQRGYVHPRPQAPPIAVAR